MISHKRTFWLHSFLVRKTLTHPEYMHTITRRYLNPLLGCMSVKPISRSSKGFAPIFWTPRRNCGAD